MRILVVEDRPPLRSTYIKIIKRYNRLENVNIEPIIVESMEELQLKLLTTRFDGALIDNNLTLWEKSSRQEYSNMGSKLCTTLEKYANFSDTYNQIILYSALRMEKKPEAFKVIDKLVSKEELLKFDNEILKPIISGVQEKELSFKNFTNLNVAQKISFYKKFVLRKIKPVERFEEFAPNLSWVSDIKNE